MPEYDGYCKICGEPIHKCYLTQGKDGKYYCAKCLVDTNKNIKYEKILKKRKYELKEQLKEIEIELEEDVTIDVMYG